MERFITFISTTSEAQQEPTLETRSAQPSDSEALARSLFAAYDSDAYSTQADAQQALDKVFAGEYGDFYPEASPVLVDKNDRVIAAILCLKNRKDGLEPADFPSIYELVTASSRRREGIAEELIRRALSTMHADEVEQVTVRIAEDNAAAIALYLSLDFTRWQPTDDVDII